MMTKKIIAYDVDEKITALRNAVFIVEQGISQHEEFEGDEKDFVHLSEYNGDELIAYARLKVDGDAAVIGRVAVRKDVRGAAIMKFAEKEAQKRGAVMVKIHAQIHAKVFYEKIGYIADGEEFMEAGIPHVRMTKTIQD